MTDAHDLFAPASAEGRLARLVTAPGLAGALAALPQAARAHARDGGFEAAPSQVLILPAGIGAGADALVGAGAGLSPFDAAGAALVLPEGDWRFEHLPAGWDPTVFAMAFALGGYQFTRYKAPRRAPARLILPEDADRAEALRVAHGVMFTRDLVNTPAADMLPSHLEAAVRGLAARFGAHVDVVTGDDLLTQNYPMIHAVGRASADAPRLIEMHWGEESHPRLALVGKGVCFDSGGLDIKPGDGMLLMKKDMGGAAAAIAAAKMVMAARLPVRLRLLVPAVENAISGDAFRPGDVLPSRKGFSVEIGNTDAEGRLILADALALADEEEPTLMADFATLTGAARVALGPDLPPFYTHDDRLAADLARLAAKVHDPIWRLPLWQPYDGLLDSRVATLNHISGGPFAGSITAALFLNRFVERCRSYVHFDIFAWNPSTKPGRPEGGEVQAARAVHALIGERHPAR